MIKEIKLKNFKCYKEQQFDLSNLTAFCGSNSSGKSTVIQAILLAYQNEVNGNLSANKIELMGKYFSFGTLDDLQCHSPLDQYIEIEINNHVLCIDSDKNNSDDYIVSLADKSILKGTIFNNDFIYLSADRYGPKNSSDINFNADKFDVGIFGEYAFSEYNRVERNNAQNIDLARAITSLDEDNIKINIVVRMAMQSIFSDFEINTKAIRGLDKVTANFLAQNGKEIRPTNVGFGFSFMFPIVLAAVCIRPGGILIVENPEVHLHPEAQSKLAQFLTLVSLNGIQVILETHSDHILNGLRIFAKENQVKNNSIRINSIRNEQGSRVLTKILIDKDGNLTDVDQGFFDQIEKDLLRLF
jgi:predicted ATPase